MFIACVVVTLLLAVAIAGSGGATLAKVPQVVENFTKVGFPEDKTWVLGVLKLLGAVGLVVGLWVAPLGIAAAAGVVLYFIGAVAFHVRAKDYGAAAIAPAGGLLVLAVVALVLRSASA